MLDAVDELLNRLIAHNGPWPPRRDKRVWDAVRKWRAFLENDRERLRDLVDWPKDRPYKVDPLPELIADAWADHLFGDEVTIGPGNDADAGVLELILDGQGDDTGGDAGAGIIDALHGAERLVVGEGQAWWRVYRDEDVADVPLLEWHSRDAVIPYYVGRRLMAAALVTELDRPRGVRGSAVYRHLEVHVDDGVEHVLFRGTRSRIGSTVPLEEHPDLVELAAALGAEGGQGQVWNHGLPMLMGRIVNKRGRIREELLSEYHGIEDHLLDLNEATVIGAENARLTAKRRVVVSEDALRPRGPDLVDRGDGTFDRVPRGDFDAGEDVLVVSKLDGELGQNGDGPFKVLEYSFDAEALISYKRDLVETALTRRHLTPQYVGVVTGQGDGLALSGTALRLRLIPTTRGGLGKWRPWRGTLPHIVSRLALVDALPVADGGFGRTWNDAAAPALIERGDPLPVDAVEDAQVEAALVGAGVRSVRTSVEAQHPDWDEDRIKEEVDAIKSDRPATSGLVNPLLP